MSDKEKLIELMIEKSQESFLMALEIYNKPTIKYKIEGFCFFICNAWELMLKAYLLKENKSIKYKEKQNKNRTISLSDCIQRVMTNKNDPVRRNLEAVVGLRHMAVHLVIPEYADLYNEVFMACTKNYTVKLKSLLDKTIDEQLSSNYLTMFIPSSNSNINVSAKYGKEIVDKFISTQSFINKSMLENSSNDIVNDSFAVSYELRVKRVKNIEDADIAVAKTSGNKADLKVVTIKERTDPSQTHPFTISKIVELVNNEMETKGITFEPISETAKRTFNTSTFTLLNSYYHFKDDEVYSYKHTIDKNARYTYSLELVQKIIDIFIERPDVLRWIKAQNKS